MKRLTAYFLALILLAAALPARAETWYVYTKNGKTLNLRDEYTNEVIGNIPYGTALEPDSGKSTEKAAYVTYKGVSGFVKWSFLRREKPKSRNSGASRTGGASRGAVSGTPYHGSSAVPYQGPEQTGGFEITALGAYIQYADKNHKGAGQKWETLRVSAGDNIVITADVPRGKKIDYWVINGIRYDFNEKIKSMRLTKADADFQFEVVYTNSESRTLISPQIIQDTRTGGRLLLKTIHAQMCHLNRSDKGAGGWMTSFDFTEDYVNLASNEMEDGGQITSKVKAVVPKNRKIRGWKFNETELYPNSPVTHFIVRTLNTSMTYEPILGKKNTPTPTKPPAPKFPRPVVPAPPITPIEYFTVNCTGCKFSGGGYSNATSGQVPKGTKITVNSDYFDVDRWTINGSVVYSYLKTIDGQSFIMEPSTAKTLTRTIKQNTDIVCIMKIN